MQIFLCLHQESLGFSQAFPSSHAAFPISFHRFGPVAPGKSLVYRMFPFRMQNFLIFSAFGPHCTKNFWVSTGFPSSDATCPMFFHFFGPSAPRILGFSQDFSTCLALLHPNIVGFSQNFPCLMLSHDFSSSDANFPTCAYKQTYHHGASRICKNLQIF